MFFLNTQKTIFNTFSASRKNATAPLISRRIYAEKYAKIPLGSLYQ